MLPSVLRSAPGLFLPVSFSSVSRSFASPFLLPSLAVRLHPRFSSSTTASTAASSSESATSSSSSNSSSPPPPRRPGRLRRVLLISLGSSLAYGGYSLIDEEQRSWQLALWKTLPLRLVSRAWGAVHSLELPEFARLPLYHFWADVFNANLDEAAEPLLNYKNLSEFFVRRLKPGVRPIDPTADLVAPVDALVTALGEITDSEQQVMQQIKGMDYKVSDFLGERPTLSNPDSKLFYIVFYLAPGDYHRIHSSADATFVKRRHFPGYLFPVKPSIIEHIPNAFVRNERIVLTGQWKHGYFSLSPVGALNVGSIRLNYDEGVICNRPNQKPGVEDLIDPYGPSMGGYQRLYADPTTGSKGLQVKKGDEVARFELGSTVVLVFEASKQFQWTIQPGDRSKVGQKIADIPDVPPKSSKSRWF